MDYENKSMGLSSREQPGCLPEKKTLIVEDVNFVHVNADPSDEISEHWGKGSSSERLLLQAVRKEYSYGKLGLIFGIFVIIGGVVLGLHGVVGSTSWTASIMGLKSEVNDATPGVVLFIVGLFMILMTKPKVNLKNMRG